VAPDGRRSLRLLVVANAVSSAGNGLWLAAGLLYLTRSVGLPPIEVGVGLTAGALMGVLAGVPIGAWADVAEPRRVAMATFGLEAVATAGYLFVDSLPVLVVVATLCSVGLAGSNAARGALLAGLFGPAGAAHARGALRAAANLGISVGTVLAGVVLVVDSRQGYQAMLLLDVLTFLLAAALLVPLPNVHRPHGGPAPRASTRRPWRAVRDTGYLAVTALNAVMTVQYGFVTIAVPLWVATATAAPLWAVAAVLFVNAGICVLFQVRAGRGLDTANRAARAARTSGWLFLVAAGLFATTAGLPPAATVTLLLVAGVIHSLAELRQAASSFSLSFLLAATRSHGQYQGVWGIGVGLGEGAAPAILTGLLVTAGGTGWLLAGAVLAVAGMCTPWIVGWAEARR
jgi:MFS family permease